MASSAASPPLPSLLCLTPLLPRMVPLAMSGELFGISPVPRLCSEPRLALHPVGTRLWLPLNLQWFFPVLCPPFSLIWGLSLFVLILLPEDCCLQMLQWLELQEQFLFFSLWPGVQPLLGNFSLGARAPRYHWLTPCVACPTLPSFSPSPTLDSELHGAGVVSPVPSIALVHSKGSENVS